MLTICPVTLEGSGIRLEPLSYAHEEGLAAARRSGVRRTGEYWSRLPSPRRSTAIEVVSGMPRIRTGSVPIHTPSANGTRASSRVGVVLISGLLLIVGSTTLARLGKLEPCSPNTSSTAFLAYWQQPVAWNSNSDTSP